MGNFTDGSYELIGCAMRVHSGVGPGLREKPCENALVLDLRANGYHVEQQKPYPIRYLDQVVGDCIPDLTLDRNFLIDAKSDRSIGEAEEAQMLNLSSDLRTEDRIRPQLLAA